MPPTTELATEKPDMDEKGNVTLDEMEEMLSSSKGFVHLLRMVQDGEVDLELALKAIDQHEDSKSERLRRVMLALYETLFTE